MGGFPFFGIDNNGAWVILIECTCCIVIVMFENFKKITIEGGYFEQPTTLDLFKDRQNLSIVYGRNGSGKTTIAKAIRQLVGKDTEQPTEEGYVSYSVSTDAIILDDKKDSVFIFDEEFVRENVRTKGKGLETIVMMGEQVDLDTQITNKNEEKIAIEKKVAEQTTRRVNFENGSDASSPLYFYNKIRDKLREDGGWADIDRNVKGNSVRSRVTEDLLKKLVLMEEPKETEEALRTQLNADLTLYTQTEDAQAIVWNPVKLKLPKSLDGVKALFEKRVEKPTLNEREHRLLTFLQEHAEHHLQETTQRLAEEKWPFCPLCLRKTSDEDYEYISETLKRILNKESEIYSKALDEAMDVFVDVEMAIPKFPDRLNEKEREAAQRATVQLNKDVAAVRNRIIQRKRDIYGVMEEAFNTDKVDGYSTHLTNYMAAMQELEVCVATFNRSVNEREKLKRKVLHENELLAKKRLTILLDSYKQANKAYENCQKALSKLEKDKERTEGEIKAQKARIERTDIAQDYINEELQYVFYSDTKVKLVAGDGCYKLKVNGRSVPPKKISVGERNVLGLCYFFARLFSDKKKDDKYKDEILIIIDDPVSSFDYGNRLGVMSLLRHQFDNIKKGNSNSRILLLTHDLRSAFDMVKVRSELNGGKGNGKTFLELVDKQMKERVVSNEYKKLLEYVYDYAKTPTDDKGDYMETSTGNVMRRVVEAFSSFCYNMKFEEMMCRDGVLKAVPDEKRTYYENFMCRLALNGESHMEERVYDLNTITPYFTKQEKVQTAKSLLLFLSYINEEHLSCYLAKKEDGDEDRMAEIKSWETEEAVWMK